MFSPLRLFLAIAFRLLAPLNMMNAEDAGSSSASGGGGGASKKRSNEENKINVYWKGFLDAQIQAEHANLRAIAHAGRLDTMRRSIYWGYKQNPNACTNVALAVNCSSADKFLEYTLEASLIPTRGIKKKTWKNQVSAYNKLLKKCSEFEKWTEDNPELFDSEEFVERFVQANIECTTWTQIHAKIHTPKVLPQAAMASLTQGVENNKAAESKETSSRGSRKAAAKAKTKMEEVEDDGDEEYDEGTEKKEETDALEEKSTDPQKAKLMTFYEQVKTKKGKMDVFNLINKLEAQLEEAAKEAVQAYEEKIDDLEEKNEHLLTLNSTLQQKWNFAKRQKLADKEGKDVNEIQDTAVTFRGATQEIMDWDEEE